MPTSNFKLFDENKTNAMSDAEYASANQRLNGVQSGIASSKLQNKFQIQMSMVAYAIAQLMVQNGYDATDSTAITTFVSNLSNSVLQKVLDKATTAQAQAGTDNTKWMTPALVKSAIQSMVPSLSPSIDVGSYVGTGAAGPDNKNSLTFSFVPYMVVIVRNSAGTFYPGTVLIKGQTLSDGIGNNEYSNGAYALAVSWYGKSVSWYHDSSAIRQLNAEGESFYYFAIGK